MKMINLWDEMMPQSREQCMVTWVFVMAVKIMEYYSKKLQEVHALMVPNEVGLQHNFPY